MSVAADLRAIVEVAPLLRTRAVSSVALVQACLARIEAGAALNAFITVTADSALREAAAADAEIAAGRYRGPLHGIPISIKDLVDVAGTPTTSGSHVPPRRPVTDAPIVRRLRDAGAVIVGKTNLHEFAFGTTGEETAFGPIHHPLDPRRSAGGSSSGAAVAIVEGMCFASVGTDTGGSIRIPSAACGTVGLKAAFGELPCEGVVPLSTTLDHVGPLARSVADASIMYAAMLGHAVPQTEAPARLVFGVPETYFCEKLVPEVRAALEQARRALTAAGHDVRPVEIARAEWTADVYLHIVLPEASALHAANLDRHADGYSPGVRLRLEMGRYLLADDYLRALRLRDELRAHVDASLDGIDALLLPALPITAPVLGEASVDVGGTREPVRAVMLRLTQLFNITGHPAIAMPAGRAADGFPLSLQLVGPRQQTARLLAVAAAAEPYMAVGPGSVGGGTG